jgi:hypothetical protein
MKTGRQGLDDRIAATLSSAVARFGAAAVERIAASRLTKFEPSEGNDPRQRPTWLYTPGLSTRPFWARSQCGRLIEAITALEQGYEKIRDEIRALDPASGVAYDHLSMRPEQAPGWKNWFFYQDHRPDEALLARVPTVRDTVERLPREQLDRFEIHLSVLEPGAHIPPHCGGGNAKLTLHLPLHIPEGDTAIRVGGEQRGWREGEVLIFDDSFVHEAWNRTQERRAVLLLTAYHPDLSREEIGVLEMLEPINVEVYREYLRQTKSAT